MCWSQGRFLCSKHFLFTQRLVQILGTSQPFQLCTKLGITDGSRRKHRWGQRSQREGKCFAGYHEHFQLFVWWQSSALQICPWMIQETGATSDESDDGIRTITFHRKDLLHSPDFSKFGGTKKMQVVLSGRGNVVAVFIRKISISQAFNFSLASLFYTC